MPPASMSTVNARVRFRGGSFIDAACIDFSTGEASIDAARIDFDSSGLTIDAAFIELTSNVPP
jgi:hypothetical protein